LASLFNRAQDTRSYGCAQALTITLTQDLM
jgi:hypothetical protein